MRGLLDRLVARTLGTVPVLQPRPRSLFEPGSAEPWAEAPDVSEVVTFASGPAAHSSVAGPPRAAEPTRSAEAPHSSLPRERPLGPAVPARSGSLADGPDPADPGRNRAGARRPGPVPSVVDGSDPGHARHVEAVADALGTGSARSFRPVEGPADGSWHERDTVVGRSVPDNGRRTALQLADEDEDHRAHLVDIGSSHDPTDVSAPTVDAGPGSGRRRRPAARPRGRRGAESPLESPDESPVESPAESPVDHPALHPVVHDPVVDPAAVHLAEHSAEHQVAQPAEQPAEHDGLPRRGAPHGHERAAVSVANEPSWAPAGRSALEPSGPLTRRASAPSGPAPGAMAAAAERAVAALVGRTDVAVTRTERAVEAPGAPGSAPARRGEAARPQEPDHGPAPAPGGPPGVGEPVRNGSSVPDTAAPSRVIVNIGRLMVSPPAPPPPPAAPPVPPPAAPGTGSLSLEEYLRHREGAS